MLKSKLRYIFTWVALVVLLICSILLLAVSWNGITTSIPSPVCMVLLWIFISTSGIFLFMLAVKKAHRQWVNDERSLMEERINKKEQLARKKDSSINTQKLDFTSTAGKLVRRVPEKASLDNIGSVLLNNLASELEIMSGVYYLNQKGTFKAHSSYALSSSSEPYSFKAGEGLTGQVARNQQLTVLTSLPEDYLEVFSGLGKAKPTYVVIAPLVHKNKTVAVIECSGYRYDPQEIENMFRILTRDLMEKISLNLK